MTKIVNNNDKNYEKVNTDDILHDENEPPLKYGFGIRHIQCVIIFLCLCVTFIARAHLSVTIVAMTDVPRTVNIPGPENPIHIGTSERIRNIRNTTDSVNENPKDILDNNTKVTNNDESSTTKETVSRFKNVANNTKKLTLKYVLRNVSRKTYDVIDKWNVYRTYSWPKSTQEMVLGAFFLGYMIMMSPMGMLAQRFGGKLPLQIGLFSSGVISLATPWLAVWGTYRAVSLSRVAMGLLQAGTYPSILTLIAKWVPVGERGRLGTYVYLGSHVGSVLSYHLSGLLVASKFGWPSVFWVTGVLCLIMVTVLTIFVTPTPQQHRSVSQEEKKYIMGSRKEHVGKRLPTPWKAILTSKVAWATFIAHIGGSISYLFFFNQMPTYMHFIVGFNIKSSGLLSSLPYIANLIFSSVIGNLADHLVNRKTLTLKQVRVISSHIANFGPAICLFAVSFTTNPVVAVILLVLCMGTHGATHTGWMVNYIDLAPNFSSTLMATGNTLANFTGLLLPVMISVIVTDVTNVYQWRIMLFAVGLLALVCNAVFAVFMSADVQPWNDCQINEKENPEDEELSKEKDKTRSD